MRISSLALAMAVLIPAAWAAPVVEDPHAPSPAHRVAILTPHKLSGEKTAPAHPAKAPTPAKRIAAGKVPAKGAPVKKASAKKAPVKSGSAKVVAKKAILAPAHHPAPHPAARVGQPAAVNGAKHPLPAKPGHVKPVGAKPFHPVVAKKPLVKGPVAKKPAVKTPAKALLAKKATPAKMAAVKMGPPAAERKAVQSKYDAMSLLVMHRDGNRLAALFMGMTTPDFVYRDKKGHKLNRTQLVMQLKRQMKMVKAFKRSGNKVTSFAVKGPVGTAGIVSDFAMVFPNGTKTVTVAGQSATSDTWIKTAKGWKLRSIRTLRESVKYNGKPM